MNRTYQERRRALNLQRPKKKINKRLNVTGWEPKVYAYIYEHPGGVSHTQIMNDIGIRSKAQLTSILKSLVEKELVHKDTSKRTGKYFPVHTRAMHINKTSAKKRLTIAQLKKTMKQQVYKQINADVKILKSKVYNIPMSVLDCSLYGLDLKKLSTTKGNLGVIENLKEIALALKEIAKITGQDDFVLFGKPLTPKSSKFIHSEIVKDKKNKIAVKKTWEQGKLVKEEQIIKRGWKLSNLQPLESKLNIAKGNRFCGNPKTMKKVIYL